MAEKGTERASAEDEDEPKDAEFEAVVAEDKQEGNEEGKVVIVVLRPTAPRAELSVEDGQLGAESQMQTSGP